MKEFLAAHIIEVIGIAFAAITAIGVGPWLASRRQRKIAEQDTKLRAHFEDLKREAEPVISLASNLVERYGKIEIKKTEISDNFQAHFSEQSKDWRRWEQKANKQNRNYENLRQKIKIAFEAQGIPVVVKNDQGEHSICIFEAALDALFNRWGELAWNRCPWPDFQKVESKPIYNVKGAYLLHASGWGANAVAFANTEDEQEKCKLALGEIAGDMENQGEAAKILDSASKLVKEVKDFADQLASEINDIHKFWPGKKTNRFKRLKKTCPKCKELF